MLVKQSIAGIVASIYTQWCIRVCILYTAFVWGLWPTGKSV